MEVEHGSIQKVSVTTIGDTPIFTSMIKTKWQTATHSITQTFAVFEVVATQTQSHSHQLVYGYFRDASPILIFTKAPCCLQSTFGRFFIGDVSTNEETYVSHWVTLGSRKIVPHSQCLSFFIAFRIVDNEPQLTPSSSFRFFPRSKGMGITRWLPKWNRMEQCAYIYIHIYI